MSQEKKKEEKELEEKRDERIEEYGQLTLEENQKKRKIHLLSIIGEVEGHENAPGSSKTTKYDHVLPQLAQLEDDDEVKGMLVLLNTSGGDVDAGLAIAEMIASLSMIMEPMTDCSASMLGGNILFNNASSICPSPACIYLLPLSLPAHRPSF